MDAGGGASPPDYYELWRVISMNITIRDASDYFRGLLLLIRKDHTVSETEIHLMKQIGKTLGFDKDFCDGSIQDILGNKYIEDTPPKFSDQELAVKFIKDGLTLAASDGAIHPNEVKWLAATAEINGVDFSVISQSYRNAENRKQIPAQLEVEDLTIQWS
jgi:uncharacterized tellurite resistance protein B-like protein